MRKILIATHGKMASGVKYTAELLLGQMADITTIDAYVNPEDNPEAEMEAFFQKAAGEQVVVLTDLQGGSVNQKLLKYSKDPNVILITGFNLAILIQVMMAPEPITAEDVGRFIEDSRQELKLVSLAAMKQADGAEGVDGKSADGKSADGKNAGAKKADTKAADTIAADAKAADTKAAARNTEASAPTAAKTATAVASSAAPSAAAPTSKIAALRVDDRLIHGQVAMTWTKQLKVKGILVANDDAAADSTQKMALKMAAPAGIKVLVKPVEEAIRVLNHPKAETMRILVLTRTIQDALLVRSRTREIEFLNIGNVGRFDGIDASEKTVVTPTIMLTTDEIANLKQLVELDQNTCMQQVPNGERKTAAEILSSMGL